MVSIHSAEISDQSKGMLASHKIEFFQAKLVIIELEVHPQILMTYLIPLGLCLNNNKKVVIFLDVPDLVVRMSN